MTYAARQSAAKGAGETYVSLPPPALLRKAAGRNLHEKIANTLGLAIVGGEHPEGSLLPTEIELCARLSVSRSALREAFKLLGAKRLIQSRQKVGTTVRPRTEWNMLDPDVLAWSLSAAPTDAFFSGLFEVRQIVEPAAAALSAERRSEQALQLIAEAMADMERFQTGDVARLTEADLRFHQGILDATGNAFLADLGAVIENALRGSFQLSWQNGRSRPDLALRQHQRVLDAIRARDPEAARDAMTVLLGGAIADVRLSLSRRAAAATERD
jgi:DNA-binding FadR family transcriptional regulator